MPLNQPLFASLLCLLIGLLQTSKAASQKRWDGEAGDGRWQSEKNWHPDGLPDSTEVVVLDNQLINIPYLVVLPDGPVQTTIGSLVISPAFGNSIRLEIPSSNTASPALALRATGHGITLKQGEVLVNRSGAAAGNTITLSGTMRIENGGRYLHQTIRGNADLVSRLATGPGTEKGDVAFDVPGNNSYPLSVSGRTYGRLLLCSGMAGKKTYTGTGNNPMVIGTDLLIDDSSRLLSSLNGDIQVRGQLLVEGELVLNPNALDSIGRQLIFMGDSTAINIKGKLEQGPYFKNILVQKGVLLLQSDLQLNNALAGLTVEKGSMIVLDSFCIRGPGVFYADSGATVAVAGVTGVDADEAGANIQSLQAVFHPNARFVFLGAKEQCTGKAFPTNLGTIRIEKSAGKLVLSKPLILRDSLVLLRGRMVASTASTLTLQGRAGSRARNSYGWSVGNDSSFVDGPIKMEWAESEAENRASATGPMDADSLFFPIGRDSIFAPIIIARTHGSTVPSAIEASYHLGKAPGWETPLPYPLKSIGASEYWSITTSPTNQPLQEPGQTLHLSVRESSTQNMTQQPHLVLLEQDAPNWELLPMATPSAFQHTVGSTPMFIKTAVYTLGELHSTALDLKTITLRHLAEKDQLVLKGESSAAYRIYDHFLEQSKNGKFETTATTVTLLQLSNEGLFSHRLPKPSTGLYFRVKVLDAEHNTQYSNTLHVQAAPALETAKIFPNPASNRLNLLLQGASKTEQIWIVNALGFVKKATLHAATPWLQLDISGLQKGKYWLILEKENKQVENKQPRLGFIKQ